MKNSKPLAVFLVAAACIVLREASEVVPISLVWLLSFVFVLRQYCGDKFSVEAVDVKYEDSGEIHTTPLLSTRTEQAAVKDICSIIGVEV